MQPSEPSEMKRRAVARRLDIAVARRENSLSWDDDAAFNTAS
jgi:hypothetical protein